MEAGDASSSSSEEDVGYTCPWSFSKSQESSQSALAVALPPGLDLKPAREVAWVEYIVDCPTMTRMRASRPRCPSRKIGMCSSFAGLKPEIPASDLMGIPTNFVVTSELLPQVREASMKLHGPRYIREYKRAEEHIAAVEAAAPDLPSEKIDLVVLSPACQPWSLLRDRGNTSARTQSRPDDHPWWSQTFHLVPFIIQKTEASGVLVEQVWQGFATECNDDDEETAESDALK